MSENRGGSGGKFTRPDGTRTDDFDDCRATWEKFAEPVTRWLSDMELMTCGPGGVSLINSDYKRQVTMPPWFVRRLTDLLDDYERLAALVTETEAADGA